MGHGRHSTLVPSSAQTSTSTSDEQRDQLDDLDVNDNQQQLNDDDDAADDAETASGRPAKKTTMIVLCDDGSLKIYVADASKTKYWMHERFRSASPIIQLMGKSADLFQPLVDADSIDSLWSSSSVAITALVRIQDNYSNNIRIAHAE